MKHDRAHYIPKGARKFADRFSTAVVYAYQGTNGMPCLMGFHGKAQKPDFHFCYRDQEQREAKARSFFEGQRAREQFVRDQAAKRKARGRGLEVGDVLKASWGYDQTNIDFYQVTKLIGDRMVEIREIGQEAEGTDFMQGKCVPVLGRFIGKPMRKRAEDGSVRIASYSWAHKIQPKALIGGQPVFEAAHFTSYA